MIPSSEQLESFLARLRDLDRALAKLKGAEVRKAEIIAEIKAVSKDWLRFSEALRAVEALPHDSLNELDAQLKGIFQSTNVRTRSSAYRNKLASVLSSFTDKIIISIIRHEGSPAQVLSGLLPVSKTPS